MTTCYLNGDELWLGSRAFGWNKETLKDILKAIKRDKEISEVRLILGSEVSYMVAEKIDTGVNMDRARALKIAEANLPFKPVDEGFDWQKISLIEGEDWVQIAAIEPDLLKVLVEAVKGAGMNIRYAVPAAAILAKQSENKDAPVLVKWEGKEKVSVLAFRGMVDYVGSEPDEKINSYARHKWRLAVNPEQMVLRPPEYDLEKEIESLPLRGDDSQTMKIEIKKDEGKKGLIRLLERDTERGGVSITTEGGPVWRKWIGILAPVAIVLVFLTTLVVFSYQRSRQEVEVEPAETVVTQVVTPPEATAPAEVVVEAISINVLNGSGITGEAARIRDELSDLGFTEIEIGNAPSQARTTIAYKSDVPGEILSRIVESLSEFEIGDLFALTSEKKFDVEIVIGSTRKQ